MRTIWDIAYKDLLLSFQSLFLLAISLVLPAILIIIIGNAISVDDESLILNVDIVDEDQSALSERFIDIIASNDSLRVCVYGKNNPEACELDDEEDTNERLEANTTVAVITIPDGFQEQLQRGETPIITYQSNEDLTSPTVASQSVNTAITALAGPVMIAQIGRDILAEDFLVGDTQTLFDNLLEDAQNHNAPVVVHSESTTGEENEDIFSGFDQTVPGTSTMFVMLTLFNAVSVLVVERQTGTLQRLFTLPVPRYQVVLGKMLSPMLFALIQFTLLIVVGSIIGNVDWGNNPVAVALIVVAFILAAAAIGFTIATFVRTEDQASGMATFLALTLAPLGGAWWPLEIVPDLMVIIGHISPIAWAMDGFQDLIWYDGGLTDVLPEVGVLLLYAVVFTGIGVWKFKYE
ncbi:MAG: ABC transporter permease [Chloroflexi bacterium]|nr:ABC transporter permease [Chloroflexota bacterium]